MVKLRIAFEVIAEENGRPAFSFDFFLDFPFRVRIGETIVIRDFAEEATKTRFYLLFPELEFPETATVELVEYQKVDNEIITYLYCKVE